MNQEELFYVVKNLEEQYSIWPHQKSIPLGWEAIGDPATKNSCLEYIDKHWVDLRPKSLREKMPA